MDLPIGDFRRYSFWKDKCYTRNCIVKTEGYELLLLCWEEGQSTAIHCHGGEECWVYTLKGMMEERRYEDKDELVEIDHEIMAERSISYMNDQLGFHSLRNIAKGRSITLHLYAAPVESCGVYDQKSRTFVQKKLSYSSLNGIPLNIMG